MLLGERSWIKERQQEEEEEGRKKMESNQVAIYKRCDLLCVEREQNWKGYLSLFVRRESSFVVMLWLNFGPLGNFGSYLGFSSSSNIHHL